MFLRGPPYPCALGCSPDVRDAPRPSLRRRLQRADSHRVVQHPPRGLGRGGHGAPWPRLGPPLGDGLGADANGLCRTSLAPREGVRDYECATNNSTISLLRKTE